MWALVMLWNKRGPEMMMTMLKQPSVSVTGQLKHLLLLGPYRGLTGGLTRDLET